MAYSAVLPISPAMPSHTALHGPSSQNSTSVSSTTLTTMTPLDASHPVSPPTLPIPVISHSFINEVIEWSEEYSVHIPLIDTQHQHLFHMIEDLRQSILLKHDGAHISRVLKGLTNYCVEHFESEELLMQSVNYPGLSAHQAVHQEFTDNCIAWIHAFSNGTLEVEQMLGYLVKWLVTHILHNDKEIASYCLHAAIDTAGIISIRDVMPQEALSGSQVALAASSRGSVFVAGLLALAFVLSATAVGIQFDAQQWATWLASVALVLATVPLYMFAVLSSRSQALATERAARIAHARQLAENLLASDIASRIAVMDLESIQELFDKSWEQSSPLVCKLQSIVDHLQMFRKYIPAPVFALLRTSEDASEQISPVPPGYLNGASGDVLDRCTEPEREVTSPLRSVIDSLQQAVATGSPFTKLADVDPTDGDSSGRKMWARRPPGITVSQAPPQIQERRTTGRFQTQSQSRASLARGLRTRFITCLAIDAVGFHGVAQGVDVDDVVRMHGDLIAAITETVDPLKGVVNFVLGDHIFCTWNACFTVGEHSPLACEAALKLHTRNEVEPKLPFRLKMALTSGAGRVGNIGSDTRIDFAIVSPLVPSAFSLCKLATILGVDILIDNSVWINVRQKFHAEIVALCDNAQMEWPGQAPPSCESETGVVYELLSAKLDSGALDKEWMYSIQNEDSADPSKEFNEAVKLFYSGRISECSVAMREFLHKNPSHSRAAHYLAQCEHTGFGRPLMYKYGWQTTMSSVPMTPEESMRRRSTLRRLG
eukprot:TRINITY_DN27774_c0_g1_i1.p1 TRINITY_DN27774_c0_g1~~TRINITY_DN27774_c0_g1_i1.p1  ORF type:complete len:770 (+),score=72.43 TRINITY_DN27774_c0_g1_i1:73-2382(+)